MSCIVLTMPMIAFVDEKVVDLEAQRRAEELQAAKDQLDASGILQPQQPPNLSSLGSREGTVGPS